MNTIMAVNKEMAFEVNDHNRSNPYAFFETASNKSWLPSMVILIIGGFYLLTIRRGHFWGDDYSVYIQNAKNIVDGVDYNTTGYLYLAPYIGPGSYPPIFPLLLAPVYWLFGINLTAMKVEIVVVFLFSLLLLLQLLKEYLSIKEQIILLAMVGFNPVFWEIKDRIQSEPLFLVTINLSIYFVCRYYKSVGISEWGKLAYILGTGVSFYLAYGTRSVGLLLLPCLLLYDVFRNGKLSWPSFYAVGVVMVAIALIMLQSFLLPRAHSYVEQVQPGSQHFLYNWMVFIRDNVLRYTFSLAELWDNIYSKLPRIGLTILMSILAVIGFIDQAKRKVTFLELFVGLYAICIIIVPMTGGIRYLLPIVSFYLFYSLQGIKALPQRNGFRTAVIAIVVISVTATYAASYNTRNFREVPNSITKAEAIEFFEYVKKQTNENDVFIFTKPRALALFTGRKSSFFPLKKDDKEAWEYFRTVNATYLVVGPVGVEPHEQVFFTGFVGRNKDYFREVYANADFVIYQILDMPSFSAVASKS